MVNSMHPIISIDTYCFLVFILHLVLYILYDGSIKAYNTYLNKNISITNLRNKTRLFYIFFLLIILFPYIILIFLYLFRPNNVIEFVLKTDTSQIMMHHTSVYYLFVVIILCILVFQFIRYTIAWVLFAFFQSTKPSTIWYFILYLIYLLLSGCFFIYLNLVQLYYNNIYYIAY